MKQLIPYIMFPGTCKEALNFYTECLGGEITRLQTVAESHLQVAGEHKQRIFDSEFKADKIRFKASDDDPNQPLVAGQNFALFVDFSDETEQRAAFEKLSGGGKVLFPLEQTFGMVVDKYGIQWMLNLAK